MGSNVKDILLTHSRYIRDHLVPVLAREGKLNEQQRSELRTIFASLATVKITVELLQYSRIEKALAAMCTEGSAWPVDATLLAEALLSAWEISVGPMRNIRADLWGPGGRLEGTAKFKPMKDEATADERRQSTWSVDNVEDPSKAYKHGHIGFEVGSWWIKPAAAFRDGIIGESRYCITADEAAAYAIRLEGDQESKGKYQDLEVGGLEPATIQYNPPAGDPGIRKLTRAVLTRDPIRVLRSWNSDTPLAPKGGLRYDGLYRVVGYGLKLEQDAEGHSVSRYSIQLSRRTDPPQDSLEKALAYPTADQMDDWKDYQRVKAEQEGGGVMHMLMAAKEEVQAQRESRESRESGYFSANPSEVTSGAEDEDTPATIRPR